jgi:hypothetical protein
MVNHPSPSEREKYRGIFSDVFDFLNLRTHSVALVSTGKCCGVGLEKLHRTLISSHHDSAIIKPCFVDPHPSS